jgi:hypothetical protein
MKVLEYLPHSNSDEKAEDYDVAFLEHLQAEAITESTLDYSKDPESARTKIKEILQKYEKDKSSLTKADLYAIDRLVLAMAPADELRAEAPALYQRYCDERGEVVDPNDPAMKRPVPGQPEDPKELESLRARLRQILRSLHWSYALSPLREKRRVELIVDSMWLMVAATAVLGLCLWWSRASNQGQGHPFFAVLAAVVYAGIMGGAVSCTRRLGDVPTKGDALGSIYALTNSRYVLFFAPLTGAVFAVVTMLLFIGGALSGGAFPNFSPLTATGPVGGEWTFSHSLLPVASKDYALLFLWCFISGFAERFIPDTLTQITQRAGASQAAPPSKEAKKTV